MPQSFLARPKGIEAESLRLRHFPQKPIEEKRANDTSLGRIWGISPKKTLWAGGGIEEAGPFMGGGGIPGQSPDEVFMFIHPMVKTAKLNRSFRAFAST